MYDKQSMFIYPKIHSSKYLIPSITTFGFFIASMLVRLSLWLDTDGLKSKPRKGNPGPNSLRSPNTNTSPPIRNNGKFDLKRKKTLWNFWGHEANFWRKVTDFPHEKPASLCWVFGGWATWRFHKLHIWKMQVFFMNPRFGSLLKSGRCWNLTCKKYTM